MPTDLDLVNAAYNEAGQDRVPSLDNTVNSKQIQTAIFQLPRCKRAVLRVRDWNCARKRAELEALDASALSLGEWSIAYRLPPDCLAVRRFASTIAQISHAKFSVEIDTDDKKILFTNRGNNRIIYTADMLDVNRWDALLFDACATRLAIEFSMAFTRDLKFLNALWEKYRNKIEETTGVDEAEGGVESVYDSTLVNVRF